MWRNNYPPHLMCVLCTLPTKFSHVSMVTIRDDACPFHASMLRPASMHKSQGGAS